MALKPVPPEHFVVPFSHFCPYILIQDTVTEMSTYFNHLCLFYGDDSYNCLKVIHIITESKISNRQCLHFDLRFLSI